MNHQHYERYGDYGRGYNGQDYDRYQDYSENYPPPGYHGQGYGDPRGYGGGKGYGPGHGAGYGGGHGGYEGEQGYGTEPHFGPKKVGGEEVTWKDLFQEAPNMMDIGMIRSELEGPKPLRVLAGLAGLCLSICTGLLLLNFPQFFINPPVYVIEGYMFIFGLIILLIELKSSGNHRSKYKQFLYRWFPFVSVIGGKGLTYILFGTLGVSLQDHPLLFLPSIAITIMGVAYCAIHLGKCKTLENKYDKSIAYSRFV